MLQSVSHLEQIFNYSESSFLLLFFYFGKSVEVLPFFGTIEIKYVNKGFWVISWSFYKFVAKKPTG